MGIESLHLERCFYYTCFASEVLKGGFQAGMMPLTEQGLLLLGCFDTATGTSIFTVTS